ncbi:MAG: permease [Roseiflexaceae bacterium]|nr:permease [Roseiflexaceae bacterium]
MSNRTVLPVARASFERVMPIISLMILVLIVAQALVQSVSAWVSGADMKHVVPVFEAPIASAGKALGAALTSWMPAWVVPTPFGPLDVKYTASYTIYEWFKLPIILFLTTYGMALLRLRVSTRWIERSIGRNDLAGAAGGAVLGMCTPVCSCTVTNIYAGIVAGGASQRASSAFLFASPALNEFAILFMFVIVGPFGGMVYVATGFAAALATAYLASFLGLDPARFVQQSVPQHACCSAARESILVRAHREAWALFRRLFGVVLFSGLLAGILVNFNLTLVESLKQAGAAWWGPLAATALGLPLDINAASTAPILVALHQIVPIGTLVTAMMATTVSSIPEWVMLNRLIGRTGAVKVVLWYAAYVALLGLLLNWLFA